MSNPYAAPSADLSKAIDDGQTYTPRMYALNGRIGRLRYIAYATFAGLILTILGAIAAGVLIAISPGLETISMVAFLPAFAASIIFAIRRFNDMDQSGWLSILILVPFVNFFVTLWLLFGPGSPGSNRYGPAPTANTRVIIIGACLPLIVGLLIGVLAAVAYPAYLKYSQKAQEALEKTVPVTAPQ